MLDEFIKKINDVVKKTVSNSTDWVGQFIRPQLPSVKIETRIQALYSRGISDKTRKKAITEIVVHGTGGGNGDVDQFVNWQLGGERASDYNQGISLVHFVIGTDGRIVQTIDPKQYWVYHSSSVSHDEETIGIELCNSSYSNSNQYTDAQYTALAALCDKLMRENKSCRRIVSHNYNGKTYSALPKNCPGTVFDWARLKCDLDSRKWYGDIYLPEVILYG